MRLVTYAAAGEAGSGVGLLAEEGLVDLTAAGLPSAMLAFIEAGPDFVTAAARIARSAPVRRLLPSERLAAPIPRPRRNIFCVGKNYREHAREMAGLTAADGAAPELPILFTKATTAVIGPGAPIESGRDPYGSVDYEGELAVVIGRGGRDIPAATAFAHVFGYTLVNDVTAREVQKRHAQWLLGKSIDSFCPMGPAILTADAVPDVTRLELRTTVNGELRQRAMVADLITDIPSLIETIARYITLLPGDIIATGTPAGVGAGFKPPRFLKPGDRVAVEIDEIGRLENPVA